jgi:thymidylate synthase (FAD)|nr:MAG TPA: Thymidylate synthase complementing protein [Crassvirales sp.]
MKLCKPSYEIWKQSSGLEGIYKQIELAGRICYRSSNKITEDSAKPFVDRMIKSGHHSVLEHGTVYLKTVRYIDKRGQELGDKLGLTESDFSVPGKPGCKYDNKHYYFKYKDNPYSKLVDKSVDGVDIHYITTNYRVLIENGWLDDLKFQCEPTKYHAKRVTVKFVCDRVTGESFLRHRAIDEDHPTIEGEVTREMEKDIDSFSRESTRYCNYTKDKFNGEFTIITPPEFYDNDIESDIHNWGTCDDAAFRRMCYFISEGQDSNFNIFDTWYFANFATQWSYNRLIELGWKPQQARRIIPLDIKSPLVMTAFVEDWKHFFYLRCAPSAHPQARELAIPLEEKFKSLNLI